MSSIRSVLWMGRGERFAADLMNLAPTLDVVWEREARGALALPLESFDAAVLDADDAASARATLAKLRARAAALRVLVILPAQAAASAPSLLESGAADVVPRAEDSADRDAQAALLERIERIAREPAAGYAPARARPPAPGIVGESRAMQQVFALAACASRSAATVLLTGETGTGKEVIAQAIHRGSPRAPRPFVPVNCAAFPDTLLESELFGHVRGAFTGADRDKRGLFEEADRGTLFLDEVSETSAPFQAKLLRALQEREVRPVGGARARRVDARVIAATNRDLRRAVAEGGFRADLYYRLAVFPIHVPPLRERPGDILRLAEHFLALHGAREGASASKLSGEAQRLLQAYAWPGNVRELDNEIQRALAIAGPGVELESAHFSERLFDVVAPVEAQLEVGESLRETLARIEAWLIRRALDQHGGRRAATARRLRLTREGLYKKMKRLGIE